MNDYLLSLFLGVIEGLTEFLPVSSTAHLRITQALFDVNLNDGFWKMYTVVIQLGAVLCLPVYFRKRIVAFVRTFPRGEDGRKTLLTHPVSLTLLAFVCTAVPAFLMKKVIGKNLESLFVMGMALVAGGAIMWAVDYVFGAGDAADEKARGFEPVTPTSTNSVTVDAPHAPTELAPARTRRVEDMSVFQAVWIGLIQTLAAVFPGLSRSMSTIAAGQVSGMTRASALEFSFFLSLPTMTVATLYDFYKTVIKKTGDDGAALAPVHMTAHNWVVLAIGFVVSFVVALGVVHWFMGWVRKRGFTPFAIYRIVVGAAVLAWAMTKGA
ncbi:MAG TPA: undecaprenyl-diphosphate phosphatase [Tepidisphaeraceae bacterium]|nr:undecaprenyl-diphosphate phosphatase [Tepidisphaeraceae bacterium]